MKLRQLILPTLVAGLVAAQLANAAVYQWSKTAGSNATADPSINWAEGMSPSAVNDSARAMMARVAEWRDDLSGMIATGGTGAAYTLTTNSSYPATPTAGTVIGFFASATNSLGATLRVDGGGTFPIETSNGVAVSAGTIVSGSPYRVLFCTGCGSGSWLLIGVYGAPNAVPLGAVIDYTGTSAPNSNFALANGQCISRTTYASYFALVSTTFGVPDLRGRVVAGTDMGGGVSGRITVAGGNFDGTVLGGVGGLQNHTLTVAQLPVHTPAGTISLASGTISQITPAGSISQITPAGSVSTTVDGQTGGSVLTIAETGFGVNVGGAQGFRTLTATSSFTGTPVTPTFTGTPVTPTFTGGGQTFTGVSIGSGSAHPIVQPTMTLSKIVRIF